MSWLSSPALESPPSLRPTLEPLCAHLGLPALAPVAHLAIYSCLASFALQKLSAILSPVLAKGYYPPLKHKRDDWDLHIVGWVFSLVATPLAFHLIRHPSPELAQDPLYGSALREERLSAIAVGYFIWDAIVSFRHIRTQGLGFFLHGFGCCLAFLFTLRPFLLWCGPNFLIWELSTIFLNFHWFCDKFKMTGSKAQMINGVFLVSAYIGARLCYGSYNSFKLFRMLFSSSSDLSKSQQEATGWIRYLFVCLNLTMNGLNMFWFRAMVMALKKRFSPASGSKSAQHEAIQIDGKLNWNKNKGARKDE
ncbi:hypothetical protein JCM1840_005283 [Sporobolomyces johnsonii]